MVLGHHALASEAAVDSASYCFLERERYMAQVNPSLFENPLWLAPMAGVTEPAFRTLCIEHGAGLTYTEMVSAKALEYANDKTHDMVVPAPAEDRIAIQLFGHEPDVMARQVAVLADEMADRIALVDVNMGCPVLKVHKKGEGAALMRTPQLAADIVKAMTAALEPYGIPVTAKFRSGWDEDTLNAVEFAKLLEQAGAAALGVHGRTAKQLYRGQADWSVIRSVADAVQVPVIGSGDVFSTADAHHMMSVCGAAAVFVARGARGNPWIFSGHEPTQLERLEAARRHLELYIRFHGDAHLSPMRAHLSFYVHGQPGAAELRRGLGAATTAAEFYSLLDEAEARSRQQAE